MASKNKTKKGGVEAGRGYSSKTVEI